MLFHWTTGKEVNRLPTQTKPANHSPLLERRDSRPTDITQVDVSIPTQFQFLGKQESTFQIRRIAQVFGCIVRRPGVWIGLDLTPGPNAVWNT